MATTSRWQLQLALKQNKNWSSSVTPSKLRNFFGTRRCTVSKCLLCSCKANSTTTTLKALKLKSTRSSLWLANQKLPSRGATVGCAPTAASPTAARAHTVANEVASDSRVTTNKNRNTATISQSRQTNCISTQSISPTRTTNISISQTSRLKAVGVQRCIPTSN